MRGRYRLKTVVPTLILLGAAVLLMTLYANAVLRIDALPYRSSEFGFFSEKVSVEVWILLRALPLIGAILIFAFVPHKWDPFLPLIVFFVFSLLIGLVNALNSWSLVRTHSDGAGYTLFWKLVHLLLMILPGLLNAALWRKKWLFLAAAGLSVGIILWTQIYPYEVIFKYDVAMREEEARLTMLEMVGWVGQMAVTVLAWMTYCLMIRPVEDGSREAADPAAAFGPAKDTIFCTQCGTVFPAVNEFCPRCGAKRYPAEYL